MNNKKLLLIISLLFLFSSLHADLQTGSIKGRVSDEEGNPLSMAIVYLNSPEISSLLFSITPETGKFRFFALPSGEYTIIVELPEYKRTIIENIVIRPGKTVKIPVHIKKITAEEGQEDRPPYTTPALDSESTENITIIERTGIREFPFRREMAEILESLPGVNAGSTLYPQKTYIIHGAPARSSVYALDGAILNSPKDMSLPAEISFDVIEEVSTLSSGHSADKGDTDGGYINIISKTYGRHPSLELIAHHTSNNYNSDLRETEAIESMGVALPPLDDHLWDISFSLCGPVYYDKVWMFASSRLTFYRQNTPFFAWTDPQEELHRSYDWENNEISATFKLSTNLIPSLRASLSFNFLDLYQPYSAVELEWNTTPDSTYILDHQNSFILNGLIDYKISEDTSVNAQGAYVHTEIPRLVQEDYRENPRYYDELTGYSWGGAPFNDVYIGKRFQLNGLLSHYLLSSKTIEAEVQAGLSYQYLADERNAFADNNLLYHYINSSPYFYGMLESPDTGNTVGAGRITLSQARETLSSPLPVTTISHYGFFVHNSVTIAKRITLNFSIRFDRSSGTLEAFKTPPILDPLSFKIGEELIEPLTDSNPFGLIDFNEWKNAIIWTTFSPHAGISIDVFGNSRTLLKASYGRYAAPLLLSHLQALNPYNPDKLLSFIWYDENDDGLAGEEDSYDLYPLDYRIFSQAFDTKTVNPDLKAPRTDEITVSLQQELFPDFSLRLAYIQKTTENIIEDALFDPESGQTWYMPGEGSQDWWEVFNTTIPGVDDYPDSNVPVYFQSEDAPLLFYRLDNVPELKREYRALEFIFEKRMSHRWQLFGSLVLSKATGNIGLGYTASSGMTSLANTPNALVNISDGALLDHDRPVVAKLMGAYELPWAMYLSFYYRYMSGAPWARQVTVVPPSSWIETSEVYPAEAVVYLEEPGARRYPSVSNLDIRLEKTFQLKGRGRLAVCIDFLNLLGYKTDNFLENDGGFWYPAEDSSSQGIRILHPKYGQIVSLTGFQGFRFSFRLSF